MGSVELEFAFGAGHRRWVFRSLFVKVCLGAEESNVRTGNIVGLSSDNGDCVEDIANFPFDCSNAFDGYCVLDTFHSGNFGWFDLGDEIVFVRSE